MPLFKVWSLTQKKCVIATSLHDLISSGRQKLGIKEETILVFLEDGTEIDDDDVFQELSPGTILYLLNEDDEKPWEWKNVPVLAENLTAPLNAIESSSEAETRSQAPEENKSKASAPETNNSHSQNHSLSSNWVEKYEIPWHKMSCELSKTLKEKKRLEPEGLREFIAVVSKSVFSICPKPGKANLKLIAKQAILKYPASFSDVWCGDLVAGGYETLTRKLTVKFENLNRRDVFNTTKRKFNSSFSEDVDEPPKRKITKSDQYGCVNWQLPALPDGESDESQDDKKKKMISMFGIHGTKAIQKDEIQELLRLTYYSQRLDINRLTGIKNLINSWPLLFTDVGLLHHFETLVGINIKNKLKDMATKRKKIMSFFKQEEYQKPKVKELFAQYSEVNLNNNYILIILLLMDHFSEKKETLFKTVECSATPREIECTLDLPATPCLIICGDIDSATFMLTIDKIVVNEDISTFNDGVFLLFASFFCFNIHYTSGAECSLEFIQRCFLGINPDKGTKAGRKKKSIFNNKVLTFIEKLMLFEWC